MPNRFSSVPRASSRNLYALDMCQMKVRNDGHVTGNGFGLSEKQVMYTLDTVLVHAVAVCSAAPRPAPSDTSPTHERKTSP